MTRPRVPCPHCPDTMVKGSEMCRACRLAEMKTRFGGYYAKRPKKLRPFFVPRYGKKSSNLPAGMR